MIPSDPVLCALTNIKLCSHQMIPTCFQVSVNIEPQFDLFLALLDPVDTTIDGALCNLQNDKHTISLNIYRVAKDMLQKHLAGINHQSGMAAHSHL